MKWLKRALLGALWLAACGPGGGGSGGSTFKTTQPAPAGSTTPAPVAPAPDPDRGPCPDGVKVRIVGTNPGSVSALSLVPGTLGAICAPGAPICVGSDLVSGPVNLSTAGAATELFTFNYPPPGFPPGGAPMRVLANFTDGTARLGGTDSGLAFCGFSVSFTFDPARINRQRCAVNILLDVERSIVPNGAGVLSFVPQYRVFF